MKKIYTLICVFAVSLTAISQVINNDVLINPIQKHNNQAVLDNFVEQTVNSSFNSTSTLIWESDFSDPNDWVIDNQGAGGGAFGWTIDATVDSWYYGGANPPISINSTSGGNFAEVSNGNPTGAGTQLLNVTYNLTTAQPIDILGSIGSTNALLSFEEFGARFNDLQAVQISTDGVNFTTIADNLNYQVLAQAGGSSYPNPSLREINLSSFLSAPGANASTVWIRFSWTTNFPTSATNPNVWITYGWFIDDVKIYSTPANAISMTEEVMGGWWVEYLNAGGIGQDYTFNPISQATANPYAFEAVISNEGTVSQEVTMYADVFGGTGSSVFTTSSNPITLGAAEQDTFVCSSFFTPTNTGTYQIQMWSVADSLGLGVKYTYSDTAIKETIVTDIGTVFGNVYGKDYNNSFGYRKIGTSSGGAESATSFDIFTDETLYTIDAYISDWSVPGSVVYGVLYENDATSTTPILVDQTDDYIIQASDVDDWISLAFSAPVDLFTGTSYRIAVGGYLHPTDSVGIDASVGDGSYSSQSWYDTDDAMGNGTPTWYSTSFIPMMRMSFDPSSVPPPSSVSNVEQIIFSLYPNPTKGEVNIKLHQQGKYKVKLINTLGQVVFSTTLSSLSSDIDLSNLDKGIYTIELEKDQKVFSERLILQ